MDADHLRDHLIDAELATGEREASREEAQSHVLVRIGRITSGVLVTILGIAMLPLPGPGMLIVAAGLVILSADVPWAERALIEVRRRTPGIPEDGKIPRATIVKMVLITGAGILASVWWTFYR